MVHRAVELACFRFEHLRRQVEFAQRIERLGLEPEHRSFEESELDEVLSVHPLGNLMHPGLVGHPENRVGPIAVAPADKPGLRLLECLQRPVGCGPFAAKHGEKQLSAKVAIDKMGAALGMQLENGVEAVQRSGL